MCAPASRLDRKDHDASVAFLALGFATKARFCHRVVDDLPLKRVHRFELHRLTGGGHLSDDLLSEAGQSSAALETVPADVEHQPAPLPGYPIDRHPRQLLEGIEYVAVWADELHEIGADNSNRRALTFDVHVDVAVQIGDVQESLEVIRGDLAFLL